MWLLLDGTGLTPVPQVSVYHFAGLESRIYRWPKLRAWHRVSAELGVAVHTVIK